MEQRRSVDTAIIGAGVIGLACTIRLASQGREVLLIDPREPGIACSYGNAGAIAPYGCGPVGNPGVLRDLPKLLSAAESPLALRWSGVLSVLPWLLRFLRQSLPRPARANALALSRLLVDAVPASCRASASRAPNGWAFVLRYRIHCRSSADHAAVAISSTPSAMAISA